LSKNAKRFLENQMNALSRFIETNPIPVTVAVEFLHVKADGIRASMGQERCPFGFSWKIGDKSGFKIPTLAFYNWIMGSAAVLQQ
jgi:hypothetical protein